MIYTLTLNPAIDYIMKCDDFISGETNRCSKTYFVCGGKGINVSSVLSELDAANTALGFVGGFVGEQIENTLKQNGIKTDFIHLKNGISRINVKLKSDSETEINAPGPIISNDEIEALLNKLNSISSGDCLVLAGSIPLGVSNDIYLSIFKMLKDRGVNIIIDSEKNSLIQTLKYKPFLIKPNIREVEGIFDCRIRSIDDVKKCGEKLRNMGARNVIISMSKDGSLMIDENNDVDILPSIKGKVLNSVGAGDSMIAGFAASYQKYGDTKKAHRFGSVCGSATAFSEGIAKKDDIMKLISQSSF